MMSTFRRLVCLLALLPALAPAQKPKEAILPADHAIVVGGGKIALGDTRAEVYSRAGRPAGVNGNTLAYPGSVQVKLGPDDRVYLILFSNRFPGRTPGGVRAGSSLEDVIAEFPGLAAAKQGWNAVGKMGFYVSGDPKRNPTVTAIRFETTPGRKPAGRPPRAGGGRDDGAGRGGRGDRGGHGGRGNRGGRGGRGDAGGSGFDGARGTIRDGTEIWSRAWRTDGRRWVAAPAGRWPADRGVLLVRVDHDDLVTGCEHRFFGGRGARITRGDHVFDAGLVENSRGRARGPASWEWFFAGTGRVKVKILWFGSRRGLDTWVARHPFADFRIHAGARRGRPVDGLVGRYDRLAGDVRLVWEKQWRTRENYGWVTGPDESWPRDTGVLLLRAIAGRGVDRFFYRVGERKVPIGFGDHVLPADVLPRGGLILDKKDRSLRFAAAGEGPVRVEVYWVPEQAICDRWCREHPFSLEGTRRGAPVRDPRRKHETPSNPAEALAWLFGGAAWRARDDYEEDWSHHAFADARGTSNVASPRHGGVLTRSSRDRRASRGYETDGGIWYSAPSRYAWVHSRFYCPSRVDRIDIATAGSSRRAAHYVIVELQRQDGLWVRAAGFRRENINWYRTEGGRVVSRPPVSIPVAGRDVYVGVRVLFAGAGPFRLGGLTVLGRFAGDPTYSDGVDSGAFAGAVVVDAGGRWIDTSCDVRAGSSFYVDVEGALLGRVGNGPVFEVVAGRPIVVDRSGRLWLRQREPRAGGPSLDCTIVGGVFGAPARSASPDAVIAFEGTLRDDRSRRPVQGADVIIQLEAWPRTVFGGGRTDDQGRYAFDVAVPRGVPVVIRIPEYKTESVPTVFDTGTRHRWDGRIR